MKKKYLIIAPLMIALFAFFPIGCTIFGIRTVEEHSHQVALKKGKFQIRTYEPAIVATTEVNGVYDDAMNDAFRRLAGYIFGKNDKNVRLSAEAPATKMAQSPEKQKPQKQKPEKQKIAMTMPVVIKPEDANKDKNKTWEMTFVMPKEWTMDTLPAPLDNKVKIAEQPGYKVAIYRYSGVMEEADLKAHVPKLYKWIDEQGYETVGDPWLAGYDPPWTVPFMRRNEVQVKVKKAE